MNQKPQAQKCFQIENGKEQSENGQAEIMCNSDEQHKTAEHTAGAPSSTQLSPPHTHTLLDDRVNVTPRRVWKSVS